MSSEPAFRVDADAAARAWLESHPAAEPRVISYEVTRCCGGGKICSVRVRGATERDRSSALARAVLEDGTIIRVHEQAAARLPARFALTVRGIGPLKHLDLDLEAEQWGRLLYD